MFFVNEVDPQEEKYDYILIADNNKHRIIFLYDDISSVVIKVRTGTAEKCVEALLNFIYEGYFSGIDMCDVYVCLSLGEEISFYSDIPISRMSQCAKKLKNCESVLLKLHSFPYDDISVIENIANQVSGLLGDHTDFIWNADFDICREVLLADLFLIYN